VKELFFVRYAYHVQVNRRDTFYSYCIVFKRKRGKLALDYLNKYLLKEYYVPGDLVSTGGIKNK
jgi:hypothetical protein